MNKSELIEAVVGKAGLSKKDATGAVNAVLQTIQNELSKGRTVQIVGFGTFSVKKRAARVGIVPGTGEKKQFPAKKVPRFKPGKALLEAVK